MIDSNGKIKYMGPNDTFGKEALSTNLVRQERVISDGFCVLVCISGEHYRTILEKFRMEQYINNRQLSNLYIFSIY